MAGSVAAIKAKELCTQLLALGDVKVVATDAARRFLQEQELPMKALPLLGVRFACKPLDLHTR